MPFGRAGPEPDPASAPLYAALREDPKDARAHFELGRLLAARGKSALAIIHFQTASVLAPDFAPGLVALGDAYMARGKAKIALATYDRALRADPYDPAAHFHQALAKLAQGSFARGWRDFEWRWRAPGAPAKESSLPVWSGRPRAGERVLVYGEGGAVEDVFYAHALGDLARAGTKILFRGAPGLEALLARAVPGLEIVGADAPLGALAVDGAIALGSLPGLFRRRNADFERAPGYLKADPAATAEWREGYRARGPGLILGLAWRGALAWPNARPFRLPARSLKPLTEIAGMSAIALETELDASNDAARAGLDLDLWPEPDPGLDRLAARIDATDLVVTPPGPVAALAGALGKPVYVLAPMAPGWPWLLAGRRNPWFPSMAMVRVRAEPANAEPANAETANAEAPWRKAAEEVATEIAAGLAPGDDEPPPRRVGFVTDL
jgi:tetratricopeptide (TPR) repeat protein